MRATATPTTLLTAALLLAGCRATATYRLAVGWVGPLPTWQGACALAPAAGDSVQSSGGSFAAVRPGVTRVRCARGDLALVVRTPDRVFLEPATDLRVGRAVTFTAHAADADGELDLGDARVAWTLPPPLRATDACDHMTGACLPPRALRVVADAPGAFTVRATFGAWTTTRTVTASP